MPLRVAFDCDGVLADLDGALSGIVERLFGPLPSAPAPPTSTEEQPTGDMGGGNPPEPDPFRTLTRDQQHALWAEVRRTENFWETLRETEPGIVGDLARIAAEQRWDVLFITQRPDSAGDTTQRQTQRWLAKHGFDLPSVCVTLGSRGKLAEALSLDVVVDDRPENCLDVRLESAARAILVWNGGRGAVPPNACRLGIEPVDSTRACLDRLTPVRAPGLMTRLKQMIKGPRHGAV